MVHNIFMLQLQLQVQVQVHDKMRRHTMVVITWWIEHILT